MLIYDRIKQETIDSVALILTKEECEQIIGYCHDLLHEEGKLDHYHIDAEDFQREIVLFRGDHGHPELFSEDVRAEIEQWPTDDAS